MLDKFDSVVTCFSVCSFMMYGGGELNKSVLSGSPCLVHRSKWHCCSLMGVELREKLYVWFLDALLPQGLPCAAVFPCVEGCFEVDGCDPQRLVPVALSELLERKKEIICRGVARSEACLVSDWLASWVGCIA